jgi:quercetin dioxygenase-like cupin family protein
MTDSADPAASTCAPDGSTSRAIKRRLLERVADADDSHLTVRAEEGAWQPFLDGVQIKVLHESEGSMSYLLKLAPGASLPAHRHRADEECLVLEGSLRVGSRIEVGAGGYHLAHRGALHAGLHAPGGAVIFLRGAVPELEDVLA